MGSGMKALTLAIGLDTGVISMNDAYDLSYMKVGKFKVKIIILSRAGIVSEKYSFTPVT